MASRERNLLITVGLLPNDMSGATVLDCGCGYGTLGFLLRSRMKGNPIIFGFDLFEPYIKKVKNMGLYDHVFKYDIRNIDKLCGDFEYIFALEVLEHLELQDAYDTIEKLEKKAKKMLVISLPIGEYKQGISNGNVYQIHKSSFMPKYFESCGYEIKMIYIYPFILRVIQRLRCWLLGLDYRIGNFIAWKKFNHHQDE